MYICFVFVCIELKDESLLICTDVSDHRVSKREGRKGDKYFMHR